MLEAPAGTTSAGFLMSGGAETTALVVGGVLGAGSVVDDGVDDPVVLLGEDVLYAGKVGFVAVVVAVATACAAGKSGLGGACVTGGCAGGAAGCGGGISPPIMGMGAPGIPPGPIKGGAIPMAAMWWGAIGCGAPAIGWGMPGGMPGGAPKGGMPGMPAMTAGCMGPR